MLGSGLVFHYKDAFPVCTCARARCTPPPCVVHHQKHSCNLIIAPIFTSLGQNFPNSEDSHIARVLHVHIAPQYPKSCTIEYHSLKRYQCTKFRFASSKFPEGEGACTKAQCTCIARALCTQSPNVMHYRITLIELHQCTKFGVDSSKFPKTGGPLSNKLFWSWHAQSAPYRNGNHRNT